MAADRVPLYRKVKHSITELLRDGTWKHGQAIPSEPLLARRFHASIGTVRKAIDELAAEHVLVRQQGRGTFVSSHTKDYMLNVFYQIVDREGRKEFPESKLVSFARGRADLRTATRLGIRPGDAIYRIEALLTLSGAPVIVDSIRLSAKLFPELTERIFAGRDTTIYGLFQSRFGITVLRVDEVLSAVHADERVSAQLRLQRPAPVLRIERTAYTYRDLAVDWRIRHVRTSNHGYLCQLGKRIP